MTSRYRPQCACAKEQAKAFEVKILQVGANALLSAVMSRGQYGLCLESEEYASISMIAMLVSGLACDPEGRNPGVIVPERMERIMATLVEDVSDRIEELEAFKQQSGSTQQ